MHQLAKVRLEDICLRSFGCMRTFSALISKRQRSQKNIHQLPWPKLLRRHANQRPHAKALVVDTEMRHIRKIVAELEHELGSLPAKSFGKACEGSTNWLSRHSAFAGWMVDPGPWTVRFGPWNMDALTGSDMPKLQLEPLQLRAPQCL